MPIHINSPKKKVLEAVSEEGNNLILASKDLQDDEEVVKTAVDQNGLALEFATRRMRGKEEVVFVAISQNIEALQFVSTALLDKIEAYMFKHLCTAKKALLVLISAKAHNRYYTLGATTAVLELAKTTPIDEHEEPTPFLELPRAVSHLISTFFTSSEGGALASSCKKAATKAIEAMVSQRI